MNPLIQNHALSEKRPEEEEARITTRCLKLKLRPIAALNKIVRLGQYLVN